MILTKDADAKRVGLVTRFFLATLSSVIVIISFFSVSLAVETIKVGGSGGAMGTMKILSDAFQKSHQGIKVEVVLGLGSGGAKKALLQDALHIAVTSEAGRNVETVQEAIVTGYGRSPFVFATSRNNSTIGLTSADILNIYSGKTTTWPDGKRLRLILRPETDSDTDVLKSMSPAWAVTAIFMPSRDNAVLTADSIGPNPIRHSIQASLD
jgi:phosphate transport system substrate-binding protein